VKSAVLKCGAAEDAVIYAFILAPMKYIKHKTTVLNLVAQNILYIMAAFILLGILVGVVFYFMKRLHRYRKKYHDERSAVKKMADEVTEMEQFGGKAGTKDDELQMVENPMVRQMKDMQRKLDSKELEMQQAEQQARIAESALRQDHITRLKDDKDGLAKELERLKLMLADQQAPKAETTDIMPVVRGDSQQSMLGSESSSSSSSDGAVRMEFVARLPKQGGRSKKKDLE
jgi:hypothetical protein